MRNKIWYEMIHTKLGEIYLSQYIGRKKIIRKWFKIATLIFSGAGVLGWKIWEYAPVVSCILISFMQLINLVQNQIILSDSDLDNISELRNKYLTYFNNLEKLWMTFNSKQISEENASEQFYQLRIYASEIESMDDRLDVKKIQSVYNFAHIETNNYIKQYHS